MLDLLLIPAGLLLALALRAIRRGEHRLHGHLMLATLTLVGLRLILFPRSMPDLHLKVWAAALSLAGVTLLLGRWALAWRESRGGHPWVLRVHRAAGTTTLVGLGLATAVWLLRGRL